ncbi:MAG: iron chelate uptake ABC transporter family permease subunit [Actinomycetaceae bacterium]|nr:iron chelate uptake ABC transporter family permease subunit [Actinomycetaceae bacterium]MDU0969799.1 iron chelate uptake ABC transporter family permease subunit [Actinomycetaceae bacterium]
MSRLFRPHERPQYFVWRSGRASVRFERRSCALAVALVAGIGAAGACALMIGDYPISASGAWAALVGRSPDPLATYFVTAVRAPRIVVSILVGALLGLSGALFQTVSANPLGSPDIIGFTTGSATGALVAMIVGGASTGGVAAGAVAGGVATAALIYALAWRDGVTGFRMVLVGIGISAALSAINHLLIIRAPLEDAQAAEAWKAGSLNAMTWTDAAITGATLAVAIPLLVALSRPLSTLALGDDAATGLGVRVEGVRAAAIALGVGLVACAVATCGPIAFVALAAPHSARRLAHTRGLGLASSALMGALLTLVSDIAAQRLFAPTQLAVGVVTGALGGCYLVLLLAHEWRSRP